MNSGRFLTRTLAAGLCAGAVSLAVAVAPPPASLPMRSVLAQLAALKPKPIEKSTVYQARQQPTPATAVKALVRKQGGNPTPEQVARVVNTVMPNPTGTVPVRIYTPSGTGPFPVIVYAHGGGWVIATNDTYDASARALCNRTGAVVVSIEYRKAPEYKFPAAHEDVYAVLQHVMRNASTINGDPNRVAIAGESAGGNMATAACMMARDRKGLMPVHQLLIYPVTDTRTNTPSYRENANAKPLNRAMMQWFFKHTLEKKSDANSPYLAVLRGNVRDLPPATIITAQIDPLRSEGNAYAERLKAVGVPVEYRNYQGVTHEFFGMAPVLDQAKAAQRFASERLKAAFNK